MTPSLYPIHMKEVSGNFLFPHFMDPPQVVVEATLRLIRDVAEQVREFDVLEQLRFVEVTEEPRRLTAAQQSRVVRSTTQRRSFKTEV